MASSSGCFTRRTAEYAARDLLIGEGYEVVRVTERSGAVPSRFHLIAWKKRRIIFIRIGSHRMPQRSVHAEIVRLSGLVRTGTYPGDVQYWIGSGSGWIRHLILPGGSIRLFGAIP